MWLIAFAFTRQSIESFWSLLKRAIIGNYHKVSAKYLPLYLNEFAFRFNSRKNPAIFDAMIAGCWGRPAGDALSRRWPAKSRPLNLPFVGRVWRIEGQKPSHTEQLAFWFPMRNWLRAWKRKRPKSWTRFFQQLRLMWSLKACSTNRPYPMKSRISIVGSAASIIWKVMLTIVSEKSQDQDKASHTATKAQPWLRPRITTPIQNVNHAASRSGWRGTSSFTTENPQTAKTQASTTAVTAPISFTRKRKMRLGRDQSKRLA
jgi:ISXO2-like transposase domain